MIAYPWQLVDEKLHRQMLPVKIELYMSSSTTVEEFWLTLKCCTTSASDNISSRVVMASR